MSKSRSGKEQPVGVKGTCKGSEAGRAPRVQGNARRAAWLGQREPGGQGRRGGWGSHQGGEAELHCEGSERFWTMDR